MIRVAMALRVKQAPPNPGTVRSADTPSSQMPVRMASISAITPTMMLPITVEEMIANVMMRMVAAMACERATLKLGLKTLVWLLIIW